MISVWIVLAVLGVIVNFIVLYRAAQSEPEGAMGMGLAFIFCFVPWLLPVMWVISKILDKLEVGN